MTKPKFVVVSKDGDYLIGPFNSIRVAEVIANRAEKWMPRLMPWQIKVMVDSFEAAHEKYQEEEGN